MQSHQALSDFIDFHGIQTDSVGNCRFIAAVTYASPLRNIESSSSVRFIRNGYEDGKVEIGEQPEMTAEDYHLDLSAKWQEYYFNKASGALVVTGNSPKMGGNYSVEIKCIS